MTHDDQDNRRRAIDPSTILLGIGYLTSIAVGIGWIAFIAI